MEDTNTNKKKVLDFLGILLESKVIYIDNFRIFLIRIVSFGHNLVYFYFRMTTVLDWPTLRSAKKLIHLYLKDMIQQQVVCNSKYNYFLNLAVSLPCYLVFYLVTLCFILYYFSTNISIFLYYFTHKRMYIPKQARFDKNQKCW